jgi:branched-subunit amino acid transport protein
MFTSIGGLVAGILIAVLYPVIRGYIKKEFPVGVAGVKLPPWVKRYLALFAFALLTSFIILVVYKSSDRELPDFWKSTVLGFGWEAIIEKVFPEKKAG